MNINEIWASTLKILAEKIPASTMEPWIEPLIPKDFLDGTFNVLTGQSFSIQILRKHHDVIIEALSQALNEKVSDFNIIFDEKLALKFSKKLQKQRLAQAENPENSTDKSSKYDNLKKMQSLPKLNLKYTFDNFVVGENSKLAFAAATAVAKKPGEKFNPLFIYGGSGLGKTHLMQAIGHYIIHNNPTLTKIRFVKTEEFVNDLISSLMNGMDKNGKMSGFRQKYRNADVLLIDDIQFIEGKERTMIEIFNTFEALHSAGKQIVITSDREPKYIEKLPDRLRSRFEWGIIADIQPPDIETRIAILHNLDKNATKKLSFEIIEFVAKKYSNNVRELEGAYNKISAYAEICNTDLNIDSVKQILHISDDEKPINLEEIFKKTADYYKVNYKDLVGQSRSQKLANARQTAIYISREITNSSLNEIGDFLNRKHTTILYSYDKVQEEIQTNRTLKNAINDIKTKIGKF